MNNFPSGSGGCGSGALVPFGRASLSLPLVERAGWNMAPLRQLTVKEFSVGIRKAECESEQEFYMLQGVPQPPLQAKQPKEDINGKRTFKLKEFTDGKRFLVDTWLHYSPGKVYEDDKDLCTVGGCGHPKRLYTLAEPPPGYSGDITQIKSCSNALCLNSLFAEGEESIVKTPVQGSGRTLEAMAAELRELMSRPIDWVNPNEVVEEEDDDKLIDEIMNMDFEKKMEDFTKANKRLKDLIEIEGIGMKYHREGGRFLFEPEPDQGQTPKPKPATATETQAGAMSVAVVAQPQALGRGQRNRNKNQNKSVAVAVAVVKKPKREVAGAGQSGVGVGRRGRKGKEEESRVQVLTKKKKAAKLAQVEAAASRRAERPQRTKKSTNKLDF